MSYIPLVVSHQVLSPKLMRAGQRAAITTIHQGNVFKFPVHRDITVEFVLDQTKVPSSSRLGSSTHGDTLAIKRG